MNIELKINEQNIRLSKETINQLAKIIPSTTYLRTLQPQKGEMYHFIDDSSTDSHINRFYWNNTPKDTQNFRNNNCFITNTEATRELNKRQAIQKIKTYCYKEFGFIADDIPDETNTLHDKHTIIYSYLHKEFHCYSFIDAHKLPVDLFFETKQQTQTIIDKFTSELKQIFKIE